MKAGAPLPLDVRRRRWGHPNAAASSAPGCPREAQSSRRATLNLALFPCGCEGHGGTVAVILPTGGGVSAQGSWGLASRHRPRSKRLGVPALSDHGDATLGEWWLR